MRTLTKILMLAVLALFVSSVANANVVVTLTQQSGTYSATVGAQPGDSLVLFVNYDITGGSDRITLIDPAVAYDTVAATFAGTGNEAPLATWTGGYYGVAIAPIGTPAVFTNNVVDASLHFVDGLEKATLDSTGASSPCISGACTLLGKLTFTLTGYSGVIDTGAVLQPTLFGTTIASGAGTNVTGASSLGTFTIVGSIIPEPSTASLLGLGLLGLTVAGRRRS